MNDKYEITNDSKMDLSTGFTAFETYLQSFGLPTDNVIAPPEQRQLIMDLLPSLLKRLSPEVKKDARYISKFIAGSAVGLFDASLNFVWNEVVVNIRKKVVTYGLDYFFDAAIGGTQREGYSTEEDLAEVKDVVLLDTCKKLELISDILHKKLCHILDMRNNIGSSHPTEYSVNAYELLGWLQDCVEKVLSEDISSSAITVKSIIDNVKKRTTKLDSTTLDSFEKSVKDLSPTMVSNMLRSLFGIFVSTENKNNSMLLENIISISVIVWKYSSDKIRYDLGIQIDSYRANLDEYKTQKGELFFEKCKGEKYYTKDSKIIKLTTLCENLQSAHYGWDNYAAEVPLARQIMSYITNISDISEMRFERVISVFLICRIGNDAWWHEGVSPNAKKYYDSLFELFDEDAVIIMLKYVKEHRALLRGKYRPKNFKEICSLMKSPLLSDRCNDILDYIISFTGSLDNVFEIKQFKELSVGKLD